MTFAPELSRNRVRDADTVTTYKNDSFHGAGNNTWRVEQIGSGGRCFCILASADWEPMKSKSTFLATSALLFGCSGEVIDRVVDPSIDPSSPVIDAPEQIAPEREAFRPHRPAETIGVDQAD